MNPTEHHSNNFTFKAPEGQEEWVADIRATISEDEHGPIFYTFWQPTDEELALLNARRAVAVGFRANRCPVHSVGVATGLDS